MFYFGMVDMIVLSYFFVDSSSSEPLIYISIFNYLVGQLIEETRFFFFFEIHLLVYNNIKVRKKPLNLLQLWSHIHPR